MGTKMAPSCASIFMGKLEKLFIQSAPHKPTSIETRMVPEGRGFMDSIF
jgi:hypothetical protein